jgi:hypothetical protein
MILPQSSAILPDPRPTHPVRWTPENTTCMLRIAGTNNPWWRLTIRPRRQDNRINSGQESEHRLRSHGKR